MMNKLTIKELRAQTGLSQSQFAAHFQIPVRTLQHWEQGRQEPPPYVVAMIERILESEKGNTMKLYWVSAIILGQNDKKPCLLAMSQGEINFEKAREIVARVKENHTVLSAWIDVFDENNNKQTVFHECYIDAFGTVWPAKEDRVVTEKKVLRYVVFDEEPETCGSGSTVTFEQYFTEESAAMEALWHHDRLLRYVSEGGRTFREYYNKDTGEWE